MGGAKVAERILIVDDEQKMRQLNEFHNSYRLSPNSFER